MANTKFNATTPAGTDARSEGDDRIRELKTALVSVIGSGKLLPDDLLVVNNSATPNSKATVTASGLNALGTSELYALDTVNVTADITVSGANGLDTGAEAASTQYYVWVIYNSTTDTIAALLSTSATAPTMPSGYGHKRRVGKVFNNAASNFEGVSPDGTKWAFLDRIIQTKDVANTTTETDLYSVSLPQNTLLAGRKLHIYLWGDQLQNAVGNLTIRIKLGATTLFTSVALDMTNSASRQWLGVELHLFAIAANNQIAFASVYSEQGAATALLGSTMITYSGRGIDQRGENTSAADNGAGALTLNVTAQWSAADPNLSARALGATCVVSP